MKVVPQERSYNNPFMGACKYLLFDRKPKLSICTVHQTNIPPRENVTYNKQTQTAPSGERDGEYLNIVIPFDACLLMFHLLAFLDSSSLSQLFLALLNLVLCSC